MPRTSRTISGTGVYHVILRGVNKQQIFECDEDYQYFVRILQRACGVTVVPHSQKEMPDDMNAERHLFVYAWCLMGNHVHLLVKEHEETIGEAIKRISSAYVYYYNHRYGRIGHLFQERFKSQPVNDWNYFLTLLRYIHQNPLKSHLVENLMDYKWSSWLEYQHNKPLFSSTRTVLDRVPLEDLTELVHQILTDEEEKGFIDIGVNVVKLVLTDKEVWQLLTECSGATNLSEFQMLPRPEQKRYLYQVHEHGVGPRTLTRLTGVPYSVVHRAINVCDERYSGVVCEDSPEDELYYTYCDEGEFEKTPEY